MKKLIEFLDSDILKIACLAFMAAVPFLGIAVYKLEFVLPILIAATITAFVVLCVSVGVSVYRNEQKYK